MWKESFGLYCTIADILSEYRAVEQSFSTIVLYIKMQYRS